MRLTSLKALACTMLMLPLTGMGQLFQSSTQQMIESAIKPAFVIVEQSYQLQDSTGQRFGRYGQPEFGKAIGLGILVDSAVIVSEKVAQPWKGDENYQRFRNDYTPHLYQISCKEIGDSMAATVDSARCEGRQVAPGSFALQPYPKAKRGLSVTKPQGQTNGWVVLLCANGSDSLNNVKYTIYKKTLDVQPDTTSYALELPQQDAKVLTGVYVVPKTVGVGVISFELAGFVNKDGDAWKIMLPEMPESTLLFAGGNELTPIVQPQAVTPGDEGDDDSGNDKKKDKKKNKDKDKDNKKKK